MARVTLKSQAIIIAQLEAQVAELTTQVGVLMNQLQAAQQVQDIPQHLQESYATLVDERNELIAENQRLIEAAIAVTEELDVAKERIAKQGQVIAAQPKSAPPMTVAATVVESQAPVIQVTDADKAVWAKFQRLSREERMTIINWARPQFGHVGINNIVQVRAAWHEFKNPSPCATDSLAVDAKPIVKPLTPVAEPVVQGETTTNAQRMDKWLKLSDEYDASDIDYVA